MMKIQDFEKVKKLLNIRYRIILELDHLDNYKSEPDSGGVENVAVNGYNMIANLNG